MKIFFDRIKNHLKLGLALLKNTGIKTFVRRELYLLRSFWFTYLTFYVYRVNLDNHLEIEFPENIEFLLIDKTAEIEVLVRNGYDFGPFAVMDDHRLKQGALCLCFFRNKVISHVAWIAAAPKAQRSLTDIPCPVDFEDGEAYLGRLERNPKLKRPDFSALILHLKEIEVLRSMGKTGCCFIILKNNFIPQIGLAKRAGVLPCSSARYLKILVWRWWWEKPLDNISKTLSRYVQIESAGSGKQIQLGDHCHPLS